MKAIKNPQPSGKGAGVVYISDFLKSDITTPRKFRIPTRATPEGWVKSCTQCGRHFIQRYMSGTVRGPRAELCTSCWIDGGMHGR